MFKSLLAIGIWTILFLCGSIPAWTGQSIDDYFINSEYSTKKISMDFKDAALSDILKIFSKQMDTNFVAAQNVADKKITLFFNGVEAGQALKELLDANDLIYEMPKDSNVFIVKAKPYEPMVTKVYQLKYASVSSSKLNSTISIGSSSAGSSTMGSSAGSSTTSSSLSSSAGGSSAGSSTGLSKSGLEDAVTNSLSKAGKLMEDPRTNSLIITDVPQQFEIIEKTIADLDVPVPQILIEVEMLDVSKATADILGVTYGTGTNFIPLTFTGGAKAVNYPFSRSPAVISSSSSGSGSGSGGSSAYSPGSFDATGLTAALNLFTSTGDSRILARPRLLTLNNETAQIEIATEQTLSIEQTTNSSSSTTGALQSTFTPERYTIGVILKVTPQANLLTHEITMAVSPKVIDAALSVVQPPTGSQQGSIYDPTTRGSDSILKLKDGQSMVIGGLLRNQVSNTVIKVPFFGDLPLVGALFRSKNFSKTERELIIFITPHIIDENNQMALKLDGPSSLQAAGMNDAAGRMEEVDQTLNTYELKRN